MESFRKFSKVCGELSVDEFCRLHPNPLLLYSTLKTGKMTPVGATRAPTVDRLIVQGQGKNVSDVSTNPEDWFIAYELTPREQKGKHISLGCSSGCDVKLDDASVSRYHAVVTKSRRGFYLEDADSSAGTALNGETVEKGDPKRLSTGDRISLGNIDLIYLTPQEFYGFVKKLVGN